MINLLFFAHLQKRCVNFRFETDNRFITVVRLNLALKYLLLFLEFFNGDTFCKYPTLSLVRGLFTDVVIFRNGGRGRIFARKIAETGSGGFGPWTVRNMADSEHDILEMQRKLFI